MSGFSSFPIPPPSSHSLHPSLSGYMKDGLPPHVVARRQPLQVLTSRQHQQQQGATTATAPHHIPYSAPGQNNNSNVTRQEFHQTLPYSASSAPAAAAAHQSHHQRSYSMLNNGSGNGTGYTQFGPLLPTAAHGYHAHPLPQGQQGHHAFVSGQDRMHVSGVIPQQQQVSRAVGSTPRTSGGGDFSSSAVAMGWSVSFPVNDGRYSHPPQQQQQHQLPS